jgi:nicotinamide-nucleotide amidase
LLFFKNVIAEILTIGDELLIGQVTNTNSSWIARQLNLAGISVRRITTVSDNRDEILSGLEEAKGRAGIVIITGGLGPTKDDITKKVFAEFIGVPLEIDAQVLNDVTVFFTSRGRALTELNRQQALVPRGCEVIRNTHGTAPGMWMKKDDTLYISLPGVPSEMMGMMEDHVLPALKKRFKLPFIHHVTILTQGIGESALADLIEEWENQLEAKHIKLAYLPQSGTVRLRLSATGEKEEAVRAAVEKETSTLLPLIEKYFCGYEVFGGEGRPLERIVSDLLRERHQTVAFAESCSGGYISSLITALPGASEIFKGAVVPYANVMKTHILDVDQELFTTVGAVSRECVEQLAKNVREKFDADYSLSVSGIAGPAGATAEKPVGTIWIAVANREKVYAKKFIFGNDRQQNIRMTASAGLNLLRKLIVKGDPE